MELKLQDIPEFISFQYVDDIDGNKLYYNPNGYGGITIADTESQRLIDFCNGKNTIESIYKLDGRPVEIVQQELLSLAEREVVKISEQFTRTIHDAIKIDSDISCWLHLTNSCNLACSYCYIHKTPGSMSLETARMAIDKMVESCKSHGIKNMNIKFAGGEPLMCFSMIQKIVDYSKTICDDINISYSILTNGTLISKKIASYLLDYNIGVGISLDGIGDINDLCRHDKNGKGSFRKVMNGLDILSTENVRFSIMTTISSLNYTGLLDLTKFLIRSNYPFRFSLERDCLSGLPGILTNTDKVIASLNSCYDFIETNLPEKDISSIHKFGDTRFDRPLNRSCGAGGNFFAIGHDRKLGICGMGLAKPFSVMKQGIDLLDSVNENNLDLFKNKASGYTQCSECIWSKSCAGACPLQTLATYGSYNKASPYCRIYREILPRVLRIKGLQMIRGL